MAFTIVSLVLYMLYRCAESTSPPPFLIFVNGFPRKCRDILHADLRLANLAHIVVLLAWFFMQ